MKYLRQFAVLSLLAVFALSATGMATATQRGTHAVIKMAGIEVTLQNKCTRDVKYATTTNGKTTNGVVAKGDKVKLTLTAGTTITVDGEEFMTVSDADNGQTFQVCR